MKPEPPDPFHLFDVVGIEIEYMIVDRETLAVRPIADELIRAKAGRIESEIEVGETGWSNELVLHLVELKTKRPAARTAGLADAFQESVRRANDLLEPMGAMLMPGGMHPWMNPATETRLWPHGHAPIYEAFDRIFDCRRHGWANVQSMQVSLPFAGDEEFGRLHAAIRFALPILPALAASSPLCEGKPTGLLDSRLEFYRTSAEQVPSVCGEVIPEPQYTRHGYERHILGRIYDEMAEHDPEGILRAEWVNARGCIARFDRGAIEIRLLDATECPSSDLAIAAAVTALVRSLVEERFEGHASLRRWPSPLLARTLREVIRGGDRAALHDERYLRALGYPGAVPCSAADLWAHLLEAMDLSREGEADPALAVILEEGCLARRILRRLGSDARRERVAEVYRELATCLAMGSLFRGRV